MKWIPEIMYEESEDGISSKIPFVIVPKDEEMPKFLFIFESRDTGELEMGPDGNPIPMLEMDLHQYADMNQLKENLDSNTYDVVREALGLEPLLVAATKGKKITDKIRTNLEERNS